jgi:sulfur-oxidizing protein SoxA
MQGFPTLAANDVMRIALAVACAALAFASHAIAQAPMKRSGTELMTPALQAMQRDDAQNPGMLWVAEGEAQWKRPVGEAQRSCESCHGPAGTSMRGVAARYPAFDEKSARPLTLGQRIQACRERHQRAAPWKPEDGDWLALETYVAHQSRGMPIAPPDDPRLGPHRERGEALYRRRMGQLDLACAHCHDDMVGRRLGSAPIPPAHPTGYPIYRLEWQGMGSLARRLRGCMSGVRAEPFPFGADELAALEAYLATRAAGLAIETPAVRP